jgi:hypothetical protein
MTQKLPLLVHSEKNDASTVSAQKKNDASTVVSPSDGSAGN